MVENPEQTIHLVQQPLCRLVVAAAQTVTQVEKAAVQLHPRRGIVDVYRVRDGILQECLEVVTESLSGFPGLFVGQVWVLPLYFFRRDEHRRYSLAAQDVTDIKVVRPVIVAIFEQLIYVYRNRNADTELELSFKNVSEVNGDVFH